jgi:glycosyltransferase involved in cell wall biosynthesis
VDRVTVYSAAFNRASWLKGWAESVERQEYPAKRMLVVDDHSQDETFAAAVALMEDAKQLPAPPGAERLVSGKTKGAVGLAVLRLEKNSGPSGARNFAIRTAWPDTDIFANLDSDDRYLDGYLSRMAPLLRDDMVGAVYCDYETVSPNLTVREYKEPFSRKRILEDCLLCNNSLVHKRAFEAAGVYDEQMRVAEDWDLWLRISEHFLLVHVPEALLQIHAGPHGSATTVPPGRWAADRQRAFAKLAARTGRT